MRWLALALLFPILIGATFTGGSITGGSINAAVEFILVADAHADYDAMDIPTAYPGLAVDTSGWTQYDVTDSADATTVGCTVLDGTGTSDNSSDFVCWITGISDNELLYFPDGTYDFSTPQDSIAVFRPRSLYDRRGLVFESRAAIINLNPSDGTTMAFLEGEQAGGGVGEVYMAGSTEKTWTGTKSKGTSTLTVNNTTGLSVGDWVHIYADPTSVQDDAQRSYYSTIGSLVLDTSITIDHPLPDDFSGTNSGIREWDPAINWVVRGGTIQFENSTHQNAASTIMFMKNVALTELSGTHYKNAYRDAVSLQYGADVFINALYISHQGWDKPTNGFAMLLANTARLHLHDNLIEALTGAVFGLSGQETLATYNHFAGPTGEIPAEYSPETFDVSCDETFDGNNEVCDTEALNAIHIANHGPMHTCADAFDTPGSPYNLTQTSGATGDGRCDMRPTFVGSGFHCENDDGDQLGFGDASCRGMPSTAIYSCIEFHNAANSHALFLRNFCSGSIWFDHANGPGRGNFFLGNHFDDAVLVEFSAAPGNQGDYFFRSVGADLGSYGSNQIFANNLFEGDFGSGGGYNQWGDGFQAVDNVIEGICVDIDDTGHDDDGNVCTHLTPSGNNAGINSTWTNNQLGQDTHSTPRTTPSLPGYTDWPTFAITPTTRTAPYIGPEMGDPDTLTGCLPAVEREYGTDCTL